MVYLISRFQSCVHVYNLWLWNQFHRWYTWHQKCWINLSKDEPLRVDVVQTCLGRDISQSSLFVPLFDLIWNRNQFFFGLFQETVVLGGILRRTYGMGVPTLVQNRATTIRPSWPPGNTNRSGVALKLMTIPGKKEIWRKHSCKDTHERIWSRIMHKHWNIIKNNIWKCEVKLVWLDL